MSIAHRFLAIALSVCFAAALLPACADEAEDDALARMQALVDEACLRTQVGRYDDVEEIIERGASIKGAEEKSAYGRAAMAALKGVNQLAFILAAGRATVTGALSAAPPAFGAQAAEDGDLTGIIHKFLDDLETVAHDLQTTLEGTIARYPNGSLVLNECVIYFGQTPVMALKGELDANDLRVWIGLTAALRAGLNVLLAQDFGIDVLGVIDLVGRITDEPLCQPSIMADKRCVLQLVAWILERYPRFLATVEPDGGERYLLAREASEASLRALVEFMDFTLAERDDQSDDFFVIEDVKRSADGQIASLTVVLQNYSYNENDISWFENSFFEERQMVYRPREALSRTVVPLDGPSIYSVATVLAHVENGGDPVDLRDVLLPYAQILGPVLQAVLADQIDSLVASYDPEGEIRDSLASTGLNYSDFVVLLFKSVLPADFLFVDIYGFTEAPVPLREVLPRFDYADPIDLRPTLAIEWECGYDETSAQVCQSSVTDQAHFDGYAYAFEADGIASRFGYVSLQNPSIGGYLLVNPASAPQTTSTVKLPVRADGPERKKGAVAPDDYVFNYGVHRVAAYIVALLEELEQ